MKRFRFILLAVVLLATLVASVVGFRFARREYAQSIKQIKLDTLKANLAQLQQNCPECSDGLDEIRRKIAEVESE